MGDWSSFELTALGVAAWWWLGAAAVAGKARAMTEGGSPASHLTEALIVGPAFALYAVAKWLTHEMPERIAIEHFDAKDERRRERETHLEEQYGS